MAQDYDKIFREVLKDIFPAVARKVLGIPDGHYKPLPLDMQYTSEREADQLWEVVPASGQPYILHCEFQSSNDKQMLARMMLYHAFLFYQKKIPIRQYVIFVGKDQPRMDYQFQSDLVSYSYRLIDIKSFPYQTFLESTHSEEVLLAILADHKDESKELIAERIIARLHQLASGKLELSQRALQLVRLALLRNLSEIVFNAIIKMPITVDIKEDVLYRLGEEEGKEKTALNMLKKGMSVSLVSEVTELPVERIAQLKQQIEAEK